MDGEESNVAQSGWVMRCILGGLGLIAGAGAVSQSPSMPILPSNATAPPTATPETYYLFVLNEPKPGREVEFNRWYDQQHAQDVLINPGYEDARRFILNERQLHSGKIARARYLIAFRLVTRDISRAFQYIHDNLKSGRTVPTDTIQPGADAGGDIAYRAAGRTHPGARARRRGSNPVRYLRIDFSNVAPAEKAAFASWNDTTHARNVAALPEVVQWQRFELSPVQLTSRGLPIATRYMTIYDLDIPDAAAFDRLQRRWQAIDRAERARPGVLEASLTYRAIGPTLRGVDVKRDRGLR